MKFKKINIGYILVALTIIAANAFGQDQLFSDPNVDYTFSLPDAKWKMVTKPSATNANVEYVYEDRADGLLSVRRLTVPKNALLTDVIQDEEQKLRFSPGYVAGKEENFAGRLRGSVFNFEFVSAGKNMTGRYYFLRANETTVYVLRFSGPRPKLDQMRNQTDSIARTFAVKG